MYTWEEIGHYNLTTGELYTKKGTLVGSIGAPYSLPLNLEINTNEIIIHNSDFIIEDTSKAFYFGDPNTNGSWRIIVDAVYFKIEQRVSGVWQIVNSMMY